MTYKIVENPIDGRSYFISIIPTRKQIVIPTKPEHKPLPPTTFYHLIFEAAIYSDKPGFFSKPLLVIHIEDGSSNPISQLEFAKLVSALIEHETIENLYNEKTFWQTFRNYGYLPTQHNIWSIWFWQKIKHIFLLKEP